jgi:hypothetical protein
MHAPRILGLLALSLAVPTMTAAQTEQYELSGDRIAIYNLAGEVTIEAGSGSTVRVEITRGGDDGDRLGVERGSISGRQTLRVLYPSDEILYNGSESSFNTQERVRADGTFGHGSGGDRVRIRSQGNGMEAWADMRILVPRGQDIAVYWGVGRATIRNVDGRLEFDGSATHVTATGTVGDLNLDIGSGHVEVTGAEGNVNIDTGSGHVEISGVNGDELRVDTGSGRVTASGINVTTLEIETGSGRIEVDRTTARTIDLETGSGRVNVTASENARDIRIETGSGSVTIGLPASFGAEVELETGSGGIDLDLPLTVRRWSRDHVTGTLGDGSGRLVIDTGSGSIRIREN